MKLQDKENNIRVSETVTTTHQSGLVCLKPIITLFVERVVLFPLIT